MKTKLILFFIIISSPVLLHCQKIKIPHQQLTKIGSLIYHNECSSSVEKLTFWNPKEEFASGGIGHFIWYPKQKKGPFTETFPQLLKFLSIHGIALPKWIDQDLSCPWHSKQHFDQEQQSKKMRELRTLLANTINLQTSFIITRSQKEFPLLLSSVPKEKQSLVTKQFYRIAKSPMGMYALIDYLHFKGSGTNVKERYNDQGWGLIHVLQEMKGTKQGKPAIEEFVTCAKKLLETRVANSDPKRNECLWIPGWFKRLDTYAQQTQ